MMWLLMCLLLAVVALVCVPRVRLYRRLFADSHLMEYAHGLAALKQAALREIIAGEAGAIQSPDDARILRTSAGLVLVYTVSTGTPGTYVHHASVSLAGGVTAHAVGATFILLWARLLGVEYSRLALQVWPSTVHHAEFVLDAEEQSRFAERPVTAATAEWLQAFQTECASARQNLRFEPVAHRVELT
jgi:hypothetical protein